jgi:enterochelin esterase-like enzyme
MKTIIWFLLGVLVVMSCANKKPQLDLEQAFGSIEKIESFNSEYVQDRPIDIWLPQGYSKVGKYQVLYMHDGQMLFDHTSTWNGQEWGVDETMSELISNGKIEKTIVVGVHNTKHRHAEYYPQKAFKLLSPEYQDSIISKGTRGEGTSLFSKNVCSDDYLKFLVEELKPYIDSVYATSIKAEDTYIAGSSMGGLISMYALCEYPDVFAGAACLSTHWIGTFDTLSNTIPLTFVKYLDQKLPSPSTHKIYFDYGTETLDRFYEPYQLQVDSVMSSKGYTEQNWITQKFMGADHSETSWNERLHIPITFLLGNKTK